jgi:hypothetical protein
MNSSAELRFSLSMFVLIPVCHAPKPKNITLRHRAPTRLTPGHAPAMIAGLPPLEIDECSKEIVSRKVLRI